MLGRRQLVLVLAIGGTALASASSAMAAFPGDNGRIVLMTAADDSEEIFHIGPDGSVLRNLTNSSAVDFSPVTSLEAVTSDDPY